MFDHFSPKRAFLVSWGTEFGQKTGKWSVFSSYNPKFSILEPKCGPKKIWKFWSHGPPLTPPYPPWHPPGVRGGQKWPKCIPSSPLMIIYAKKAISGGSKKLTYFFTRNVPPVLGCKGRGIGPTLRYCSRCGESLHVCSQRRGQWHKTGFFTNEKQIWNEDYQALSKFTL